MSGQTWHTDRSMLAAYQDAALSPARAASVEAHLTACESCRSGLATLADRSRLAGNWAAIEERFDESRPPLLGRLLVRIGMREHHAQLVTMTPALRAPTIVGVAALLAVVVVAALSGDATRDGSYAFFVVAPLLPLAGVAAAFGGSTDPVHELSVAAPVSVFELLLARVLAIVATTTALSVAAAIPLPHSGWEAAAWLLPALGLSAASLALSTWVPAHWAATGLGSAWVAAAAVSWRVNRFDPDVVERFVALRPLGQLLFAAIAVAGTLVLVLRREALEFRRAV